MTVESANKLVNKDLTNYPSVRMDIKREKERQSRIKSYPKKKEKEGENGDATETSEAGS